MAHNSRHREHSGTPNEHRHDVGETVGYEQIGAALKRWMAGLKSRPNPWVIADAGKPEKAWARQDEDVNLGVARTKPRA